MDKYEHVNREFIQKLFKNEKIALRMDDVRRINLPLWNEFSVPNLIKIFKDDSTVGQYLPDQWFEGKKPSREFLINIINTVHPGYLDELLVEQNKARCIVSSDANQGNSIQVTTQWKEILESHPMANKSKFNDQYFLTVESI